jgi:hypothetical protein
VSSTVDRVPASSQARCDRCGWHSYPIQNEPTVKRWAEQHDEVCPNPPPPRNGALMDCGCWNNAVAGSTVGETRALCPTHYVLALMVKANVDEPDGIRVGNVWTVPVGDGS